MKEPMTFSCECEQRSTPTVATEMPARPFPSIEKQPKTRRWIGTTRDFLLLSPRIYSKT